MGQFKRPGDPQAYGFVSTDTNVNGGLMVWDPTATATGAAGAYGAARPLPAGIGSSGAFFLGVAQFQYPLSSPIDNNNPQALTYRGAVRRSGIFPMKTTASETYVHGTALYATAGGDGLTVTTVSSGNTLVGYANVPDGSQVVGATGVTVDLELSQNLTYSSNSILSVI